MTNQHETLDELLKAPEGQQCQFKEAKTRFSFTETVKICSALANCSGGKLALGISDKRPRQVVGSQAFPQPERERENLMAKLHIRVDFQIYEHENRRVLVFGVASRPLGLPVMVDGVAWWYEGDSLVPMPENIRREIYAETAHDFSGDICPNATINDLDINAIEIFRTRWIAKSKNTRLQSLSIEQLLADCEAITSKGVTYAALILFGTHKALGEHLPQSEIAFEYRSSDMSGPADVRENFRMGFFGCHNEIWQLINLRNTKQNYQDGLFVYDILTFNERVVREALLNAVSHRNYQMSGSVFVRQYSNRLSIESPGGFPFGITVDNFLDMQSPRNRRVAEILALCGLVERSGQGMNLIYELCIKEAKALPDFNGTDANFVTITLNGLVIDKKMLWLINQIGNERQESMQTNDFLTINALFHNLPLNDKMRSRLKHLSELGIVEHSGRSKYILARSMYEVTGKSGVHTRLVGLDRDTKKALIIKHIKNSGDKGSPLKELQQVLPSLSRSQLQVLMRELQSEGAVFVTGNTNGARWFLAKTDS